MIEGDASHASQVSEHRVNQSISKIQKLKLRPLNVNVLSSERRKLKLWPSNSRVLSSERRKLKLRLPSGSVLNSEKEKRMQRSRDGSDTCTLSTIEQASEAFLRATKEEPHYICICCYRLMYRKTVIEFKSTKYNKAPEDLTTAPASFGTKQWICRTCYDALKQGKLPALAKASNLQIEDVSPDLSNLNPLEVRLTVELNNCTTKKQLYGYEIEVMIGGSSDITTSPCKYDKPGLRSR